ncbi:MULTISPECIES: AbrB family transcriptional regulator [Pseudomonas]|uniref:Membrane protein n=1 Tax=Pseudomonas fluorescens LMG 5329 TaxID=1324332 RepID=A0A0A1YRK6_PSEFL|nr:MULTISPECIES: AbrB family transcriptional regulator [Pseudomonas]KGE63918.1 membrane protein [Pseudomonas fluorescens LMG 5329]NWE04884.1 AbrB family transcriptional regulator [Pseudomonas sp. IPO3749]NWF20102.1 AbrB family transcriptional regulator [Pseudomonas sp. IPO3749]
MPNHWLFTLIIGALGGSLASWAGWPLPWVIGSLVAVMLTRCAGSLVPEIPHGRQAGQLIVAVAIGCHFTLPVMQQVAAHLGLIVTAVLLTLVLALCSVLLLHRWGVPFSTAFFALMPANSSEMVHLGRQRQADTSFIAAAHSIRLLLILLTVPAAATFGMSPVAAHAPLPVIWPWLIFILGVGWLAALGFKQCKLPNPWTFGPFLICAVGVGCNHLSMSMPGWLSGSGQLLIGCALGVAFDRSFFQRAPGLLGKVLLLLTGSVVASALAAWALGAGLGMPWLSLALGMMPGSAPEMSLTAEALGLAVTLVTAMQVIRMLLIQAACLPLYRLLDRPSEAPSSAKSA